MNPVRGLNPRIEKLRKQSLETKPKLYLERAALMTEAYKKYEGRVSIPELRALSFCYLMKHKSIAILEGELIVGEKGCGPQEAPTFPELCCHTLEDMKVMHERTLISFDVSQEDLNIQGKEIIPYWQERSIRNKILQAMTPEWQACFSSGIFTEFMEQRGPGHTVGSKDLYAFGFLDYKNHIDQALDKLDFHNDPEALSKKENLKAMSLVCDGIMILADRYGNLALEMAENESCQNRKRELYQIAENCRQVPSNKPKTYWQALQMYWFIHLGVTLELNPWDAFSPGRLDQHLISFYKEDQKEGTLDDEKALELLQALWIKFNNQPAPPKVGITLKESSTYTDFASITTGGITPDGRDGVNEVSYLILKCMDELKLLQPSSNVQISKKTPLHFLKKACEISRKGWGQPAFFNTEAIIQELLNAGKTLEDARLGGTSGCVETGAFGHEAYILTGYFNIPKVLEITLNNGYDPVTNKLLGLQTGNPEDFKSFEALLKAFEKQMTYFIDIKIKGSNIIESIYKKYMPVPFLSVITKDCISKGQDYNGGGARYNTSYLQGVGIGTITDALTAIKYNVYDQENCSMTTLIKAMKNNFEGHDSLLNLVRNKTPKYGNDDDYADDMMVYVFNAYKNAVTGKINMKGGHYRINMLPTTCHVYFGQVMEASANGRLRGKPLSEGISPEKGADIMGPSAVIKSASKMDHLSTGGTLLNQKFAPEVVSGDEGLMHMANLIKTYFTLDGHHIQFNIIDQETLIKAQKDPDAYKDLIVRVAGYSDHFSNLSRVLQDEIIERTQQKI